MKPVADNSLRQAAVFLRGLDPEAAAAMLGRLSAEEARALRKAVRELSEAEKSQPQTTGQPTPPQPAATDDGAVELQLGTTAQEASVNTPAVAPGPAERDGAAWLRSLDDADPAAIADYLSREQPRAIAAVLGYLSPRLSAGVLQSLPSDERATVAAQLVHQGEADPDSLRVITAGLSEWLERQRREHQQRSQRVATIRQILAATPEAQRPALLNSIAQSDPGVAATLAADFPPPAPPKPTPAPSIAEPAPAAINVLPFEELHRLDPRALAEALGTLGARTALLALAGAPETLLDRVTSGLPRAAAVDLRNRLLRIGPTTLAEIDRSQEAMAEAASRVIASRQAARVSLAGQGA